MKSGNFVASPVNSAFRRTGSTPRPDVLIVFRNCWDDSYRCRIHHRHGGRDPYKLSNLFHCLLPFDLPAAYASSWRISVKRPVSAAAAAIGCIKWVAPLKALTPLSVAWIVGCARSPGAVGQGSFPDTSRNPASRHSKPASLKISQRPSFFACARTRPRPGKRSWHACLPVDLLALQLPRQRRRSSMRPLVQGPDEHGVDPRCRSTPCLRSGPVLFNRRVSPRRP